MFTGKKTPLKVNSPYIYFLSLSLFLKVTERNAMCLPIFTILQNRVCTQISAWFDSFFVRMETQGGGKCYCFGLLGSGLTSKNTFKSLLLKLSQENTGGTYIKGSGTC